MAAEFMPPQNILEDLKIEDEINTLKIEMSPTNNYIKQ